MVLEIAGLIIGFAGYIAAHKEYKKYYVWGADGAHRSRGELTLMKVVSAALFTLSLTSLLYPYLVA